MLIITFEPQLEWSNGLCAQPPTSSTFQYGATSGAKTIRITVWSMRPILEVGQGWPYGLCARPQTIRSPSATFQYGVTSTYIAKSSQTTGRHPKRASSGDGSQTLDPDPQNLPRRVTRGCRVGPLPRTEVTRIPHLQENAPPMTLPWAYV